MMIENRLKECCLNCLYPEVETQQYSWRNAFSEYLIKDTKVFCKHEPVCKAYYEETEAAANENTNADK